MKEITVNKQDLIDHLHENRKTHTQDFEKAWEGFREKAIANIEARLDAIKQATKPTQVDLWINLVIPEDHTEDYDRAIQMCLWHQGEEMSITESEFRTFIQDDWGWKDQFTTSNKLYTGYTSPSKGIR